MKPETLQSLVLGLPAFGRRPAVGLRSSLGARWWSYRELHLRSWAAERVLAQHGIGRGDRVVLWAANVPELAAFLLGSTLRGVVAVPLDPQMSSAAVADVVERTEARALVSDRPQEACSLQLPVLDLYTALDGSRELAEEETGRRRDPDRAPIPHLEPDDPALILFTSGTDGRPKGIVLSHGNVTAQLRRFRLWRGPSHLLRVRMLNLCPLSHSLGLVIGLYVPLLVGLGVLFTEDLSPIQVFRAARQARIRMLLAVPRLQHLLIAALLKQPCGARETLSQRLERDAPWWWKRHLIFKTRRRVLGIRFRWVIVGGARISPADERFWFLARCFLVHGYGLTETAALVSLRVNTPFRYRPGSVGRPLRGQSLRIADDGELLVSGPHVAVRYLDGEERALDCGELATGDVVRRTGGRLFVEGRKTETIVTAEGMNVHPQEIEDALRAREEIVDAIVLACSKEDQEQIHAVLIMNDSEPPGDSVRRVNADLQPWKRIASWSVWPDSDFPRNRLLKVDRPAVVERIGSLESPAPSEKTPALSLEAILAIGDRASRLDQLARYVQQMPSQRTEEGRLGPAKASQNEEVLRLVPDLGLGSLDLLDLVSRIEGESGLSLEHTRLTEETTLGDIRRELRLGVPEPGAEATKRGSSPPQAVADRRRIGPTPHAHAPLHRLSRAVLAPFYFRLAIALRARLEIVGGNRLARLNGPFFVVAHSPTQATRIHLAVCRQALPRERRSKFLWVTAPQHVFKPFLSPAADTTRAERWLSKLFYHLVPGFLAFTLWSHYGSTRRALMETCACVGRGYCPVILGVDEQSPDLPDGALVVARQMQIPIVPMRVEGPARVGFGRRQRSPWSVAIGVPIVLTHQLSDAAVERLAKEQFDRLGIESSQRASACADYRPSKR